MLKNRAVTKWVNALASQVELLISVCTGAQVLGEAGFLAGLKATTHHCCFDELAERAPGASLIHNVKYVDNGRVILSAEISAGINMALHVVHRLIGRETALAVTREMEYDWPGIDYPSTGR